MNSVVTEKQPVILPVSRSTLFTVLLFGTLGFLWFILCRDLSLEWSSNEQYSYGWFVPFFAAFLFWLRIEDWKTSPNRKRGWDTFASLSASSAPRSSVLAFLGAAFALLLLLPVRLFEVANPDWRPLSWIHAFAVVGLTLLVIWYGWGRNALRHFAFPVCFILVAVPWLTPIEAPLVNGLMRLVAAVATETLTLVGIPAQLEGSLIRVNSGMVGVSEACSGVRSLQTSLMIGLLFGELKRLTIARRLVLLGAALAIALGANFGRAFFLVWIAASQNLAAVEGWHDIAGYAIVGAVFLGTIAIAAILGKGRSGGSGPASAPNSAIRIPQSAFILPPSSFILITFIWLLLVEASVAGWYRLHERNLVPGKQWTVRWPAKATDFRELPLDEHTSEMLRYDAGREASWLVSDVLRPESLEAPAPLAADRAGKAFLFSFRWEAGTATVLRARAHRPDICLPAVGWRQIGQPGLRSYQVNEHFALPFQHFSFIHKDTGGRPLYAETFFCLHEDRVSADPEHAAESEALPFSHWSIPERWDVVRKGLRNPGQQVMEFVLMTRHAMSGAEAETAFARLVPELAEVKR